MADRDDRDTSLSGRSSSGSYAGQDRAPSAASSGRNNTGGGYQGARSDTPSSGRSASPGASPSRGGGGYGWGGGSSAGSARTDTPSSGRSVGSLGNRDLSNQFGGSDPGHERDFSLNSGLRGIEDYVARERRTGSAATGRQAIENSIRSERATAASGPRGFGSALSRVSDQQLPNSFDLGMLGINPNINPNRFAPNVSPPTAATGIPAPNLTYTTPGRFGMTVPARTGRTMFDKLKNEEGFQEPDPNPNNPRNKMTDREVLEMEQSRQSTDYGYYDYGPYSDRLRSYRR